MKYSIIYADVPWTFTTYSEKGKQKKSPELHYPCLTLEDIKSLPVSEIATDDCVLFFWVTNPMLKQGLDVIESWGFEYKTVAFNWFKRNKVADSWFFGLGYWTRQNSEQVLLATRGNPKRISKGVSMVIDEESSLNYLSRETFEFFDTEEIAAKIEQHSKKPDIIRDRIVELCGNLSRVELFARQSYPGWDCVGNEINGMDIRDYFKKEII